jgi:hypothetical protein
MSTPPRNLFEGATARGRVIRQGDLACLVMDGGGMMIVWMQDMVQAQKWAQSRPATANLLSDRARFLDQFSVLVSRPGSLQSTRGNDRQLERLAKSMLAAGYDLAEWTLPVECKSLGHKAAPSAPARKSVDDAAAPPDAAPKPADAPATDREA